MRISGGIAKGRQLRVPKRLSRPTSSVVKQAIFSILENSVADWSRVLDLYAGSGALGIEALSRGAEWSDFVDQEGRCCAVIKENLKKAGFLERAHVYCSRVTRALTFLQGKYSIVFLDPPYSDTALNKILGQLADSPILDTQSVVVVAHSIHFPLSPQYDKLCLVKERRYGDTHVSLYTTSKEVKN